MKRIKKALKAIFSIIRNPWLLNNVISDDIYWFRELNKKFGKGYSLPVIDINKIAPGFFESLKCFAFLDGGSLVTDIALLKSLCKRFDNCSYFEIGTWRGESVVNIAGTAKECYTLNLSGSDLSKAGLNQKYIDLVGFFIKGNKNIIQLEGNSMDYDFAKLNKKFDLIFIDGDHHYDFVKNDTEKVFKHLLHDKSIIVWHDYGYSPEKIRPEVMTAILDGTPKKFREYLYHVSNTMCAVFIRENIESYKFDPPFKPVKVFEVNIESKVFN